MRHGPSPLDDVTKTCRKCGAIKPLSEFSPQPRMAHGVAGTCKDCQAAYASARREAMPKRAPKPRGSSWPPGHIAMLGTAPDSAVAEAMGRRVECVAKMRSRLGVPAFQQQRRWTPEHVALLGTMTDANVGRLTGRSRLAVMAARRARSIPGFSLTPRRPAGGMHSPGDTGPITMTTTNAQAIEAEIQAKGLTAPRVTLADIEANIIGTYYFTAEDGVFGEAASGCQSSAQLSDIIWRDDHPSEKSLPLLTFCVLVLRNGFTVTGESACASPENFDAEIGRKIARANAVQKIWPLMGYALRDRLAAAPDLRPTAGNQPQ